MQRIAKFEKVSLEQFKKDWKDQDPQRPEAEIEKIYESIRLPRRATSGSAGYDFFAPEGFTLKPGEGTKNPHRHPCKDGRGMGLKAVSEKRTRL